MVVVSFIDVGVQNDRELIGYLHFQLLCRIRVITRGYIVLKAVAVKDRSLYRDSLHSRGSV